ncbi:MAG: hypothetical protein ACI36Y_08195 [Coriobacteriales bacterium]
MRNIQKVIATGISLAMATTMCVAVPATAAFAAEADTTAAEGENAELIDIKEAIKSTFSVGDQLFMDQECKPLGSISGKYNAVESFVALKEGVDYTVEYKDNDKIGTATATLTGMGKYTGTATYTFNIIEFSITVTYKNEAGETTTLGALDFAHVTKLMADSTDNTKDQYYQYGTGTTATVAFVPAKSYLTYDAIMREVGVTGWKTTIGYATDGFASTPITAAINDEGMFFPAQTTTSLSAEGAYHVPAIITTAYATAGIETTANAAGKVAATKELQKGVKLFSGITTDAYTSVDSSVVEDALTGKRFATGINVFAIDSYTPLKANPIKVSAAKKTVKNNAKQTVKLTVKQAKGAVTYSVKSAPSKKAISVSKKGVVTIAKGAKTGKYVINVKAAGTKSYDSKTVKVTIKVTK